jgi:hypothetical protein
MANYSQTTFFGPKDALTPGDPLKIIRGVDVDAELSAISTAIATKVDTAGAGLARTGTTLALSLLGIADQLGLSPTADKVAVLDAADDSLKMVTINDLVGAAENAVPVTRVLTAGNGLVGGGDLTADRTFTVGAGTGITVNAGDVALDVASTRNVDHAAITLTAGDGLTGGGTIAANRTFAVGAGTGISVTASAVGLDTASTRNTDHAAITFTAGDGLSGGGTLAANRTFTVGAGTGITVGSTTVGLDPANTRNVDHGAVSVSAGDGLTGGGTIAANRTLTLGTGGTVSGSSTNAVTASSHTHALDGAVLRNVTTGQTSGNVTVSTSGPSGGSNGDIWLEREA